MARPVQKKAKPSAREEKTLALAFTGAPRLTDRKAAEASVGDWLTAIGRSAAAKKLKALVAGTPKLEALLLGLADGSPHLWDLATAEPDRLISLLNSNPDAHFAELLAKPRRPSPPPRTKPKRCGCCAG